MYCPQPQPYKFNLAAGADADKGPIPAFLDLLGKWPTSIPLKTMWSVELTVPRVMNTYLAEPLSNPAISYAARGADASKSWDVDQQRQEIVGATTKEINGWYLGNMLATGIDFISDGIASKRVSIENSAGYLGGIVTTGRSELDGLRISFLETNISYVDTAIRPWMINVAADSLVAYNRRDSLRLRSDIVCSLYALTGPGKAPIKRKTYYFYNAFPTSIPGEKYISNGDSAIISTTVSFTYSHYSIIPGKSFSGS